MEKTKVNNQVVSMRKFVKQAKIHVINKCTKQIKFLENRKGSEEQVAKTKRKLQRLLEEVNILKKIKPDSVSKLALSKSKDWKAVLAQKNVPLEDRCFAMLASHSPVQEAVEKFHKDNTELIPKIPELVEEWGKRGSKSAERFRRKQKGWQNNDEDPNAIPIESKNFRKQDDFQVRRQSTELRENLPNSPDLQNVSSNLPDQKLAIKEETSSEESSENDSDSTNSASILNSAAKKKELAVNDAKDKKSFDALSNSSDFTSDELPARDERKSNKSFDHTKQTKVNAANHQTNCIEKKVPVKEAVDSKETKAESVMEEISRKSSNQDIRSKLLEISMAKVKVQNKDKNRSSTKFSRHNEDAEIDRDGNSVDSPRNLSNSANVGDAFIPKKLAAKNKIKAVAVLDLNELQDVDEIPIAKSESDSENESAEDLGKQKKDPFFLRDGEAVSESDEDENVEKDIAKKRDLFPFKKKPYNNYNTEGQNNDSFQKRRFEKHSKNGNFSPFRKKQYDGFNKREQKDNSFQKRKFDKHPVNEGNSNLRDNSYLKNRNGPSFKDNKQNFKRTFNQDSDYKQDKKFKFTSQDKFRNRSNNGNLAKSPKETPFRKNQSRDSNGNGYHSKPNLNDSQNKVKDDKPLHPSWEAKKKLKEAENVKFQGKRTVFND